LALLIREEDVKKLPWTIEDSIAAVEEAYRQYGLGLAGYNSLKHGYFPPPRCEVRAEGKDLPHIMPGVRAIDQSMAYLEETGMFYMRWGSNLGNKRAYMSWLFDAKTGEVLAVIKAFRTASTLRTASAGTVAAKYLSRKDSKVAGMLGTGRQGKAQLEQLPKIRDIEKAYCHSGRRKDEEYAQEIGNKLGIDVIACDNIEDVVRNADILAANTIATEPLVKGEWLPEGLHINGIGADDPKKAEFDFAALKKVDKLVIDDWEVAIDVKELRDALDQGILTRADIHGTIGEVVAGVKSSRENDSEITFFNSTGMTMPYVTIYAEIYKRVKEQGLGTELDPAILDLVYD